MKRSMDEIEQLIENSLNDEEAELYKDLDQQGVFKMWFDLYSGKFGGWAVLTIFFLVIFTALAFYWGYKFFTAEGLEAMLRYGAGMFIMILFVQMLKLWHWMQMDKNSIPREMKRLEFQVAVLMKRYPEE